MTRSKHRARKRFGQHFLERAWADKLVAGLGVAPGDVFVEIGPGLGALTRPLAATGAAIHAIEVDRDLAAGLAEWAPPTLMIVTGDFLALDDAGVLPPGDGAIRIVGNLPYNLSTPILFRVLALARATGRVRDAVVMLQREVADRVLAAPGSGDYGPLAVMLGLFADRTAPAVAAAGRLPAAAQGPFGGGPAGVPPAAGASRRLRGRRSAGADGVPAAAEDAGECAAPAARPRPRSGGRRGRRDAAATPADLAAVLAGAGIDPTRRPETLTATEFVGLADTLIRLSVL